MTSPQGAELACGLCYEEITVQGEIDSCNHRFCHPCIARWSEIENSCPFCKQRFKRLRRKRLAPRAVLLAGGGLGPDSELPGVYEDSQDVEERNQRVVFEDPAFQEWIEELSCMVCGGGENDDLLLLCDGCDRACHTYCAGLAGIPEGEWFCEVCALSRGNRPQRSRQPVASRAAARPRGRRRQRIDESEEADSDVLEEALSSSLESSSSDEQEDEEAAAGGTARPAPRRRRIASSPAAAAAGGRRAGLRRRGRGTNVRGVRGQAPASLDDDLDGFVVPDEDEEWMSSGHGPRNSRRRPVRSSRQEASRGGSAGSGSGREEEEDLDQLPLAARLQRIREREGHLGHRGSSAVNDAPTQAHRDVMALSACWEDLRKGTATFSDLRRPSSNGSGGGMTASQPQRRRLVRAGALAAGGGGSSAGAAAAGRPRAADSGASSGGGGVVDLLSSPGFSGPSPSSRQAASPAVSPGEERLAWQAFDAAHQQQQQQQQAGQPRQRQRRRSGSGAGTLPAGGADDLDLDMSLAARIRLQIAEARERGARLAPRSLPKSQQQQQQQQPQRQRLLPGSTTGASPHRTARDMQLMAAAARGSTPRSSGQGRGVGGTASARRGFQIPRMQALDGGSNTPAVGSSPQQQAQYGQQSQQVQQLEGGMSQNPFTRFGLQPGSNSGSTTTALHWRQQGGSGSMGGPLRHEQPQQQPRPYAHQQHSSEQGSSGRHLNRDGGSPQPVYRQPGAPHSLPRHQRSSQHQQGLSPPLWHQQPQQAHSQQLSPLQQQHLPPPPPQQQHFSWPAGLHGNAQWQEGQSRQPLARVAPGMQPTTNGSRARTEGEQSPIAAESTLPPGTVVLQAAARRAAATPATTAPQQQFQQRTQQPDQQQQPQKQRQSLSKHDIVNRIKPLLKQCLAEGQLHRDTYKQANKAAVGLLFQLQRPFTAAEAEQAVQQAVHEVLQGQGSPN